MSSQYPQETRNNMIAKLFAPNPPSLVQLSLESGIAKSTLHGWLKKAKNNLKTTGNNMIPTDNKRPQNWSAAEKLEAIITTASMTEKELGAFCRENGIYSHNINSWKAELIDGLKPPVNKEQRLENKKLKSELNSLKSELKRKDKALAETAALLILKKKADLLWGADQDDT